MDKRKAILILCIVACFIVLLLVSTFLPGTTIAAENDGHWEELPNGKFICVAPGNECSSTGIKPDVGF